MSTEINFSNVFRKSFIENYASNVPVSVICFTLGFTFLISIFVYYIYQRTTKGVIYSKKFNTSMALTSIVTAAIMLAIQSNIVVSLGMVGALSIVRFRTAIKEPRDLLFLFWSIGNGIIIGAQMYPLAILLSILLSAAMIFFDIIPDKTLPFLLVIVAKSTHSIDKINAELGINKIKYRIKSCSVTNKNINVIYELYYEKNQLNINKLSKIEDVEEINLLTQDGEYQY